MTTTEGTTTSASDRPQQLHVVVALERGARATTTNQLTSLYHEAQRGPNFHGALRKYVPNSAEENDEILESSLPALTAPKLLRRVHELLARPWDLAATRDRSNAAAVAPIVVAGQTLATDVPVSTLLFLERELIRMRTVFTALPVLDVTERWGWDPQQGFNVADVSSKPRTKKVPKALELHPGTDKHAPQVHVYHDEVTIGRIETTKFSGAMYPTDKDALIDRLNKVIDAVKEARTVANQVAVQHMHIADDLLGYVFGQ